MPRSKQQPFFRGAPPVLAALLFWAFAASAASLDPSSPNPQTTPVFGTNGTSVVAAWGEYDGQNIPRTVRFGPIDDSGRVTAIRDEPGTLVGGDAVASNGDGYLLLIVRPDQSLDAVTLDGAGRPLTTTTLTTQWALDASAVWNGERYVIVWYAVGRGLMTASMTADGAAGPLTHLPVTVGGEPPPGHIDWIWLARTRDAIVLLFREAYFAPCGGGGCFVHSRLVVAYLTHQGGLTDSAGTLVEDPISDRGACLASDGENVLIGSVTAAGVEARVVSGRPPFRAGEAIRLGNENYAFSTSQRCAAAWTGSAYVTAIGYGYTTNRYVIVQNVTSTGALAGAPLVTPTLTPQFESTRYRTDAFTSVLPLAGGALLFGRSGGPATALKAEAFIADLRPLPLPPIAPAWIRSVHTPGRVDVTWEAAAPHVDGFIATLLETVVLDRSQAHHQFRVSDFIPPLSVRTFNAFGISGHESPARRRALKR